MCIKLYLIIFMDLKLLLRVYLKELFLLSWRSWEVFSFKFMLFTDKLTSCNLKIFFTLHIRSNTFLTSSMTYLNVLWGGTYLKIQVLWLQCFKSMIRAKIISPHLGISHLTGKRLMIDNNNFEINALISFKIDNTTLWCKSTFIDKI